MKSDAMGRFGGIAAKIGFGAVDLTA